MGEENLKNENFLLNDYSYDESFYPKLTHRKYLDSISKNSQYTEINSNHDDSYTRSLPQNLFIDETTIKVRVLPNLVGLVVGKKGITIKKIQDKTNTHIQTPSKGKDPIFLVSGDEKNVEDARKYIEQVIVSKTGIRIDSTKNLKNLIKSITRQRCISNNKENDISITCFSYDSTMDERICYQNNNFYNNFEMNRKQNLRSQDSLQGSQQIDDDIFMLSDINILKQTQNKRFNIEKKPLSETNYRSLNDVNQHASTKQKGSIVSAISFDLSYSGERLNDRFKGELKFCLVCFNNRISYCVQPCNHGPICEECKIMFECNLSCFVCGNYFENFKEI